MDRKYRQRGYQDTGSSRGERQQTPKPETFGPKTPKLPGTHSVSRCASCGNILSAEVDPKGKCPRCNAELHSCRQCSFFDPSARFECAKPVMARIAQKDGRNECGFYSMRRTLERQTSTDKAPGHDARAAFENLFKK